MSFKNYRTLDIKPGDKFTFLTDDHDVNYYTADADWNPAEDVTYATHTYYDRTYLKTHIYVTPEQYCTLLDTNNTKEADVSNVAYLNEAKLELAADHELRARFEYTHDGVTRDRRVQVMEFDGEAIEGESFREDGTYEGWRRFLLQRITSPVTIR